MRYDGDKERAMAHAISQTFSSVIGSSSYDGCRIYRTLLYELYAWKRYRYRYGKRSYLRSDLVCVTVLPSMILCCDKLIEKTKHKPLLPDIGRISDKVTKAIPGICSIAFVILISCNLRKQSHSVFTTTWTNRCQRICRVSLRTRKVKRRLRYEHNAHDPGGQLRMQVQQMSRR